MNKRTQAQNEKHTGCLLTIQHDFQLFKLLIILKSLKINYCISEVSRCCDTVN